MISCFEMIFKSELKPEKNDFLSCKHMHVEEGINHFGHKNMFPWETNLFYFMKCKEILLWIVFISNHYSRVGIKVNILNHEKNSPKGY